MQITQEKRLHKRNTATMICYQLLHPWINYSVSTCNWESVTEF